MATIDGRYRILERIKSGGWGDVYRGIALGSEGFAKPVVIKEARGSLAGRPHLIRRFTNEAKILMSLAHRNVVQVLDLAKLQDKCFIVLELVDGDDLGGVLKRCKQAGTWPSTRLSVYIINEVLRGLDYAHRQVDSDGSPLEIIHRDIKPGNVLCSFEGEVKLADFGIARSLQCPTDAVGELTGTRKYMSPEQAARRPVGQRTDIFSTGVVLYLLLCRRHPFGE